MLAIFSVCVLACPYSIQYANYALWFVSSDQMFWRVVIWKKTKSSWLLSFMVCSERCVGGVGWGGGHPMHNRTKEIYACTAQQIGGSLTHRWSAARDDKNAEFCWFLFTLETLICESCSLTLQRIKSTAHLLPVSMLSAIEFCFLCFNIF